MAPVEADAVLGPYLLIERLGRGGFAEVWRARPQPERLPESPREAIPFLDVLQGLLETRREHQQLARLTKALREGLAQVERLTQQADPSLMPPQELREGLAASSAAFGRWLGELAATGELDLALKVPFHDGYVRQLRREEDLLRRVDHPNLIRQLALDAVHDPPYLAMELVEGWSLREALRQEPFPPLAKVLSVMDQLLSVLEHLHQRGLVHGDVKPENLLLERDGTLRLIDLGLGRVSQQVMRDAYLSLSLASRVPVMGTLSYMAPEVRQGQPAGPAADIYAAGIVLYEMLVGDVPSGMALPSQAAPERGLSQRYDVLLKWALHPEPGRRIRSAGELRERVLLTLNPRDRHQLGKGRSGTPREGTLDFDAWALTQASPFVAGDWVGLYQLLEPLGRGGFGEVWKAQPAGGAAVALKIALGPQGKEGLAREAEIARRLSHPQIPAYIDEDLEHDPPYLVVSYARGASLRGALNAVGRMEAAEVVPLLLSLVAALAHCHSAGVIHRDLKPENLLVDEVSGTLQLLDFGLAATDASLVDAERARISQSLESRGLSGGTFEYMAPERRRGEAGGAEADVYALGVILFESLSAQLPRGLTRLRELCAAPRGVEAICEAMLRPDPAARPTLAVVAEALGKERPKVPWFGRAAGARRGRAGEAPSRRALWIAAGAAAASALLLGHPIWTAAVGLAAACGVLGVGYALGPRPGTFLEPGARLGWGLALLLGVVSAFGSPASSGGLSASPTPAPSAPARGPRATLPAFGPDQLGLGAEALQSFVERSGAACEAYQPETSLEEANLRASRLHLGLLQDLLARRRAAEEAAREAARAAVVRDELKASSTPLGALELEQDAQSAFERALALDPLHPAAEGWLISREVARFRVRLASRAALGVAVEAQAHYAAGRLEEGDRDLSALLRVAPTLESIGAAWSARAKLRSAPLDVSGPYARALARGDLPGARAILGLLPPFAPPALGPPDWWADADPSRGVSLLLRGGGDSLFKPAMTLAALQVKQVSARAEAARWSVRELRGRLHQALWAWEVESRALPYAEAAREAKHEDSLPELSEAVYALAGQKPQRHQGLSERFRKAREAYRSDRHALSLAVFSWERVASAGEPVPATLSLFASELSRRRRGLAWRRVELCWAVEGARVTRQ